MRHLFILIMILHGIVAGATFAQTLTVKGKIHTPDSLMILFGDGIRIDTLFSLTGEFHFQREMMHPELLTVVAMKRGSNEYAKKDFFTGAGIVHMESEFKDFSRAEVTMSDTKAQSKYNEFRSRFNPLVKIARSVIDSSYVKGKTDAEKAVYKHVYDRIIAIETEVAEEFVRENTDNIVGAFVLANYLRDMEATEMDEIVHLFNDDLLNATYLVDVKDRLNMLAKLKEGLKAPDFSLTNLDGAQIDGKGLGGRYVVLDFWGSWCAPCIAGMPKMKEYVQKYGDKVNFIGIACGDEVANWKSAISELQLTWPQYLNSSQNEDLTRKFQIDTFPTKIIIDPNGKILNLFKGESADFYKYLDHLFSTRL
ncbi:TlpA family protein disulfide reductase [Sphingobacterium suaedae]|uniref:TlpA family protein disulfide reductase n=1 Tax=Sphingobacterium suaedae TaxID=1686402 RepID=A0ABW5KE62_9SPHI